MVTTFYTLECVLSFFFLRCCTSDDNISAPLDKGSLGCVQIKKIQCKKVQSDKIRLHLLFIANILRKLLTNLIPTYQAARSQTYVR